MNNLLNDLHKIFAVYSVLVMKRNCHLTSMIKLTLGTWNAHGWITIPVTIWKGAGAFAEILLESFRYNELTTDQ